MIKLPKINKNKIKLYQLEGILANELYKIDYSNFYGDHECIEIYSLNKDIEKDYNYLKMEIEFDNKEKVEMEFKNINEETASLKVPDGFNKGYFIGELMNDLTKYFTNLSIINLEETEN